MSKPMFDKVMPLVWDYYDGHPSGGSLHVVLDDGNTETYFVLEDRAYAIEQGDEDAVKIADLLLEMTRTQRNRVCRHVYDKIRETKGEAT